MKYNESLFSPSPIWFYQLLPSKSNMVTMAVWLALLTSSAEVVFEKQKSWRNLIYLNLEINLFYHQKSLCVFFTKCYRYILVVTSLKIKWISHWYFAQISDDLFSETKKIFWSQVFLQELADVFQVSIWWWSDVTRENCGFYIRSLMWSRQLVFPPNSTRVSPM